MSERIPSHNISHNKFRKRIRKLYNKGVISKENYEYLIFQRKIYKEAAGESFQVWKYLNLETHDRFNQINEENILRVLDDWEID